MIKVLQINLNHCEVAHDILHQMVRTENADLALISDPYKTPKSNCWAHDKGRLASIWACGKHAIQESCEEYEGFVRAKINGIHFYSCYAPPRHSLNEFQSMLDHITADAENRSSVIIGGDFNAWAVEWGSRHTNPRGVKVLETFSALNIGLANVGNVSTFRRNGTSSVIDITFASTSLLRSINWRVSEEYTGSDHQAVVIEARCKKTFSSPATTGPKWKDALLDNDMFDEVIRNEVFSSNTAEDMTNQLNQVINKACDAAMPKRKPNRRGEPCYWWNEEIKGIRKECLRQRRRLQRARGRDNFDELLAAFKTSRKKLSKAIKESKERHFKALCNEADINPWGTAYRTVMSKLKGVKSPQITCPTMLKRIVETLFPMRSRTSFNIERPIDRSRVPPISNEEIIAACKKIGDRKVLDRMAYRTKP